jgi:hypothetical protein
MWRGFDMAKKTYMVREDEFDIQIKLVVDTDVLTPALATEVNNFWTGADTRLAANNQDVVLAVIKLFSYAAMRLFLSDGGAQFYCVSGELAKRITQSVLNREKEGWPPLDELGIVITEAYVALPDYDNLTLEEMAA